MGIPDDPDYETIGGFIAKLTGKIPELGEKIKYKNMTFQILRKTKRRIIQLKIMKSGDEPA
jgi:CBS domain containing-hemolysin-like protein